MRRYMCLWFAFVLLCASSFQTGTNAGALTFSETKNISETSTLSNIGGMAVTEDGTIYVVWEDELTGISDVFVSKSDSGGDNFGTPLNISNTPISSGGPRIAASGDDVFVVWTEDHKTDDDEIYLVKGTASNSGSIEFSDPLNISNNTSHSSAPQVIAEDQKVHVIWEDNLGTAAPEILYASSADGGENFGIPINLSENEGRSQDARIATYGEGAIAVAWMDDTPNPSVERAIFIRASIDGGATFGDIGEINPPVGLAEISNIQFHDDSTIFVLWSQSTVFDIFFTKVSINQNATLGVGEPVNVSDDPVLSRDAAFTISDAGVIQAVWIEPTPGAEKIRIANSVDDGESFSDPTVIADGSDLGGPPEVRSLNGSDDIFVTWEADVSGISDIFISHVLDGENATLPVNLSNNDGLSTLPKLEVFEDKAYIAWSDYTTGEGEVLFRSISLDSSDSTILIEDISSNSTIWGRSIEVVGTTNGQETDSITVDWGDGTQTTGVAIVDSSWGPVSHVYEAASTGNVSIVATLLDSSDTQLASSDPSSITVLKHETNLRIDSLTNVVVEGGEIIVEGTLMDLDDNVPITNASIAFSGSGSAGLGIVTTDEKGEFSSQGASPDDAATLWEVMASFAGDSSYKSSASSLDHYDTVPTDASQFNVEAGAPTSIELTNFGASIAFDNLPNSGMLFVSECETPESERYISLEKCLVISSSVDVQPGTYAHIGVSYSNLTLPGNHTADEIDIFHESPEGFVDVTESRDELSEVVTGRTHEFSKFVVGIALHEPAPEDALRKQVFLGQNELAFNELVPRTISFDESEYPIGSEVAVMVEDDSANLDNFAVDTIITNISSTSDPNGIRIILEETGNETGEFTGTFELVSAASSDTDDLLHVEEGDEIEGLYLVVARAPFTVVFEDVTESGLAEVSSFVLDTRPLVNIPGFEWVGDAYELKLIDANIANNSQIHVIMSFVNVDLRDDEVILPDLFRILQFDPGSPPSGAFEWDDISGLDPDDPNPAEDSALKIVRGETTFPGKFLIGHDIRDPGGIGRGGGGIPRPGTGIILLDSSTISESDVETRRSGGGGGGSSRSTDVASTTSGSQVEASVRTDSGTIVVVFDAVGEGSGQLKVTSSELPAYDEIFDEISLLSQDNDEHGLVHLNGKTYSTAGEVYDIDASSVSFDGPVTVTIPYDEQVVQAFSMPESDVKFIHYNEGSDAWEDMTSNVDTDSNTVTGILSSLSPVTAALILNPSVPSAPTSAISISIPSLSLSDSGLLEMYARLQALDSAPQNYVIIVQLIDEMGIVQHLDWEEGRLGAGEITDVSRSWGQVDSGGYTLKVYLISDMQNPWLLSQAQAELAID